VSLDQLQGVFQTALMAWQVFRLGCPLSSAEKVSPSLVKFGMSVEPLAADGHVRLAPVRNVETTFSKLGLHVKPFFTNVSEVPECLSNFVESCYPRVDYSHLRLKLGGPLLSPLP
jgi:hypothetical protein